jgi:hypothetical protein
VDGPAQVDELVPVGLVQREDRAEVVEGDGELLEREAEAAQSAAGAEGDVRVPEGRVRPAE